MRALWGKTMKGDDDPTARHLGHALKLAMMMREKSYDVTTSERQR